MARTRREPLPDLPCPRCQSPDTVPLRNYGMLIQGDQPGTLRWWCMACKHRFDGPKVRR